MLRRIRAALAASILVLALAAACGGGTESDPAAAWANGFCSSLTTWANQLQTSVDSLTSGSITMDSVSTAIDDVKGATDTLKSDLQGLGAPDTSDGQQAQDSVTTLADDLEADVEKIRAAFEGASGVSELPAALSTATATIATMQDQITTTYNTLQGLDPEGQLNAALQNSQDCQQLQQQFGQTGS